MQVGVSSIKTINFLFLFFFYQFLLFDLFTMVGFAFRFHLLPLGVRLKRTTVLRSHPL